MENNQHNEKIGGMTALISKLIKKALAGKNPATIHDPHGDFIRKTMEDQARAIRLPRTIETAGHFIIGMPGKGVHHILTANGWVERSEYYRALQAQDTTHE